ncbi:MAG: hypothetical protein CM15mP59_5350 [Flavobacteriaceae bacterium]|nr:MAG: hypothetical protein CM15mP59_5350 [Flavobacteriaceae bacterium]
MIHIKWPKPTKHSLTLGFNIFNNAKRFKITRNIGIAATLMLGRQRLLSVFILHRVSHKIGEVHDGAATMDWMEQEQERGITITSAATTCKWTFPTEQGKPIEGAKDITSILLIPLVTLILLLRSIVLFVFSMDLSFCFQQLMVFEPQSETNWRLADNYKVPRMGFVNKMDRQGANFLNVCTQVREMLKSNAVPIVLPIGDEDNFKGVLIL